MSKDPAFLFYDGDAARDVSHMNRLERGCYFDLIQAQRKFGGYTVEQARKILGKDFNECWSSLELVLSKENDLYFIEWVRESILKRKENAEKQRIRIQEYWDKKKKEAEELLSHGNTVVLPLVIENEIEIEIENKKRKRTPFKKPTLEQVKQYFTEHNYSEEGAEKAFYHYDLADWYDAHGNPVLNWKSKMHTNWFKSEYSTLKKLSV